MKLKVDLALNPYGNYRVYVNDTLVIGPYHQGLFKTVNSAIVDTNELPKEFDFPDDGDMDCRIPESGLVIPLCLCLPKEAIDKGAYQVAQSLIRQVLSKVIVDTRLIVNLVEDEGKKTIQLTIKEKYEQSN